MTGLSALNQQLIERLYAADGQFCIAVTGGGTSAISALFGVPGASGTILEATVPYHREALTAYLQSASTLDCSAATARALAMMSYQRARAYAVDRPLFGVGATAAIATSRDRRGEDRCHVALQSASETRSLDISLSRDDGRVTQEAICRDAILQLMAEGAGLAVEQQVPGKRLTCHASESWQRLLAGETRCTSSDHYDVIFPGAFNPLHEGHRAMMRIACERYGRGALEISIRNVDKPPIDFLTMQERMTDEFDLVFTNAPTFVEKSALFSGAVFVVGLDTVTRIDEPKYYASATGRDAAISIMSDRGIRFLVFGRTGDGQFQTLSSVDISPSLRALCIEVTEAEYRMDISSTELREA